MKLLIGLGNPGKKYQCTRHNAGAQALEYSIEKWKQGDCFEYTGEEKNRAYRLMEFRFSFDMMSCEKLEVLFPQTYMNTSGEAVKKYIKHVQESFSMSHDLWVFHDDIDIPFGSFKIDRNASSAGHNGVQNIIEQLGTKEFIRFRIGIRPSRQLAQPTEKFVLQPFSKKEREEMEGIYEHIRLAAESALASTVERAQSIYNKKTPVKG